MNFKCKLGFIGFGNMAEAIYNGIKDAKLLSLNQIMIFDTNEEKLTAAKNAGINIALSNTDIMQNCEYVIFAVKPQHAYQVFSTIKGYNNVVISIMAGIKKQKIKDCLPDCLIVRCMPNTPALIKKGMTVIDCSDLEDNNDTHMKDKKFILSIFSSIGETAELFEDLMDAVTSISGSGPAYAYLFIDAMIKAGVERGLNYEVSKKLTLETLIGSTEMVKKSDKPLENLIDAVCSKGGTTIEAVKVFKNNDFENIVSDAVKACYDKSVELSKL